MVWVVLVIAVVVALYVAISHWALELKGDINDWRDP